MDDDLKLVRKTDDGKYMVFCAGCGCCHGMDSRWTFNGDFEKPTFTPSFLVGGCLNHTRGKEHFGICHSYVTDGMIRYLDDCTHHLKGQTVPLEPF